MSGGKSKNKKTCVRKSIKKCPNGCRVNKNTRKCDRKSKIAKKQYPKKTRKTRKRKKASRKTLLSHITAVPGETIKVVRKLPGETVRVVTKLPGKTAKVVKVVPRVAVKGVMTGVKALESMGTSAIKSLPRSKGGTHSKKNKKQSVAKHSVAKHKKRPFIYSKTGDSKRLAKKADKGLFDNVIEDAKNMGDALPPSQSKGGKKKKGGSAWTNHVNDVWKKGKVGNKNYKFKQAMSDASKSWKKQKGG